MSLLCALPHYAAAFDVDKSQCIVIYTATVKLVEQTSGARGRHRIHFMHANDVVLTGSRAQWYTSSHYHHHPFFLGSTFFLFRLLRLRGLADGPY